jgi:hypothetical protein
MVFQRKRPQDEEKEEGSAAAVDLGRLGAQVLAGSQHQSDVASRTHPRLRAFTDAQSWPGGSWTRSAT